MLKIYAFLVSAKSLLFPCHYDVKHNGFVKAKSQYHMSVSGKIDKTIPESSALEKVNGEQLLYTINDGGSRPEIFVIDYHGNIKSIEFVNGVKNKDWEDLTSDNDDNIYIGDVGNNFNNRKNLEIHKVYKNGLLEKSIKYTYKDQNHFPPDKRKMNFDCEAMILDNDSLFLISKNRGVKDVKLYGLSTEADNQVVPIKSIRKLKGMITAADISPDGSEMVLLAYGHIYFFNVSKGISLDHPTRCLYYGRMAQSEGITYLSNDELMISNEGGKLFRLSKNIKH